MAIHINHQVMMLHHLKLTLKHEKNIEKALIQVIPLLPKKFKKHLKKMTYLIQQGYTIEHVMTQFRNLFHPFVVQTFSLLQNQKYYDVMIDQTIKHVTLAQRRKEMKQKATRYPWILLMFIIIVLLGFVFFLLPFIKQMYLNFRVEPSEIMVFIDKVTMFLQHHLLMILILCLGIVFSVMALMFNQKIRRKIYLFLYTKLKLLNRVQLLFYTKFFTYIQLMLLEKKPIYDVFVELERRFQLTVFEIDLRNIRMQMQEGQALAHILSVSPMFNLTISNLFQQAQSNDQIKDITIVLSQYYYEALMLQDQQFYAKLEPILISLLSIFVGFIAYMIYEPLLSIYEGL